MFRVYLVRDRKLDLDLERRLLELLAAGDRDRDLRPRLVLTPTVAARRLVRCV